MAEDLNGSLGDIGRGTLSSSFDANPLQGSATRRNMSSFNSPTSTMSSPAQGARMPLRTNLSSVSVGMSSRKKTIIKSDPTMVSCFDPADKELYDLWAPKQ